MTRLRAPAFAHLGYGGQVALRRGEVRAGALSVIARHSRSKNGVPLLAYGNPAARASAPIKMQSIRLKRSALYSALTGAQPASACRSGLFSHAFCV